MLNTSGQDMFLMDYRVYIEGVQVPFESAYISNTFGNLPSANVTLPPWPGLEEMGRNYAPKIHIFWKDHNFGVSRSEAITLTSAGALRDAKRDAYKLIFSGIVTGVVSSKEVSPDGGGQQLTLNCSHHLEVLSDILLRFANQAISSNMSQIDPHAEGSVSSSEWDLNTTMMKALQGVSESAAEGDLRHVPEGKFDDLKGTPGMLRVLWNILKRDSKRNMGADNDAEAMVDMFIPMVESGIKLWEKMAGHRSIEEGIQVARATYPAVDTSRGFQTPNPSDATPTENLMIPGAFRTFIGEAAQKELSVAVMNSVLAGMGTPESQSFMNIMHATMQKLEYEMIVLAAPVSRADGKSIEYIVKPILPYYYAPISNVILPNLLSNITVNSNFGAMPTRTVNLNNWTALVSGASTGGVPSSQYTAPHSVRYARAGGAGGNLAGSTNAYNNKVGKYEWGRGIKSSTSHLPPMYNVLQASLDYKETSAGGSGADTTVIGASGKIAASAAWSKLYPEAKWPGVNAYNPLLDSSNISSFQRMQFLFVDHDFAMETARSRTASAAGCFNPYAIPGYPMDIIDPVPSKESYHGLCTSVTHTFHASGSATTSYSMAAVNTFSELARYNLPAVNPYLTSALDFDEDFRIYGNPKAYAKACQVYQEVLGVGAAEPALLQDYDTGTVIPFTRDGASGCWTTASSDTLYSTQQGSLMLVARNIQSLIEVESDTGNSFIDIEDWIEVGIDDVEVLDNILRVNFDAASGSVTTQGIDAESSPFLDYDM